MKILIIGGTGTIGSYIANYFKTNHEVIIAGRSNGDLRVDIASKASIEQLFEQAGRVDAIINIAGEAVWKPFDALTDEDYEVGLQSKLMGQVNLVRVGQHYLNDFGSITLTTGILADDPVVMTSSAAMVNGAIHSFVPAAQLELDRIRLNVVSPGWVEDAREKYRSYFPGHVPISMEKALSGFIKSVEGKVQGQVIKIYN